MRIWLAVRQLRCAIPNRSDSPRVFRCSPHDAISCDHAIKFAFIEPGCATSADWMIRSAHTGETMNGDCITTTKRNLPTAISETDSVRRKAAMSDFNVW